MNRALSAALVLAGSAFLGVVASQYPWLGLAGALLGGVALAVTPRVVALPGAVVATLLLIAVHGATVLRNSWLVEPLGGIANLPRTVGAASLLVLGFALMRNRLGAPRLRAALAPAGTYAIWLLVGGLWAGAPSRSGFLAVFTILIVFDICFVIASWDDPRAFWKLFVQGLMLVGTLACLASLMIMAFIPEEAETVRYVDGAAVYGTRGVFFNPGVLGEQAATTASAALAWRQLRPGDRTPWWWYPVLVISGVVVLISLSRSSLVALSGGIVLFLYLQRPTQVGLGRTALQVAGLVVVAAGLLTSPLADGALGRLFETSERVSIGDEGRLQLWAASFQGLWENPLFGLGFGVPPLMGHEMGGRIGDTHMGSHSAFLEYAILPGLPAFLLFGWLLYRGLRGLRAHSDPDLARSMALLSVPLVPIFLTGTSGTPTGASSWVLWTVLLLAATLSARSPDPQFEPRLVALSSR